MPRATTRAVDTNPPIPTKTGPSRPRNAEEPRSSAPDETLRQLSKNSFGLFGRISESAVRGLLVYGWLGGTVEAGGRLQGLGRPVRSAEVRASQDPACAIRPGSSAPALRGGRRASRGG